MQRRTMLTFSTAALLCGVYTLYSLFLSPLFSPRALELPEQNAKVVEDFRPRVNVEEAKKYLAKHAWVADAKYFVRQNIGSDPERQKGAFLYAMEWEKVLPGGEVRATPFAMIWHREGDDPNQEPLTIVAESALIKFEAPFDERKAREAGRVIGGSLEGAVQIRGAGGLEIDTRNIIYSEQAQRIWSDNPVAFRYGVNHGTGMGLELDLIPGEADGDKPRVSGVRIARLLRDVVMNLIREEVGKPPENVTVTSTGPFEYQLEEKIATFQKTVRVRRPTGKATEGPDAGAEQFDLLNSEELILVFEERPDSSGGTAAKEDGLGGDLQFKRMRAVGAPAVLISQKSSFEARMQDLAYDGQARVARLTDPAQVLVTQKNNEIHSPEVTVTQGEDGEMLSAVCRGTGNLKSYEFDVTQPLQRGPLAFSAAWTRELRKEADPQESRPGSLVDLIQLDGDAEVVQPGKLTLRGEVIRMWVGERLESEARPVAKELKKSGAHKAKPRRLIATGKVTFDGPEINGRTARLEANFEDGRLPLSRPPVGPQAEVPGRKQSRRTTKPAAAHRVAYAEPPVLKKTIQPAKAPQGMPGFASVSSIQTAARGSEGDAPRKPGKLPGPKVPVNVLADQIRLRIIQDGDKSEVAEVWNDGGVVVSQPRAAGEVPFELRGDALHLQNFSETDQIVDITGLEHPASVHDRGFELEGLEIHLDRGGNLAIVEGAGRLRLPIKEEPNANGKEKKSKPLANPQPLDVFWKERMTFDGRRAQFLSDVEAKMGENKMNCQEMVVTMVTPVSFTGRGDNDPKAEVKLIHCKESVDLENVERENGKLTSVRRAKAWEFTLDQITGDTTAVGPMGSVSIWNRGHPPRAGLTPTVGAEANKPQKAEKPGWEFTRVNFSGMMRGNTKDRRTVFNERVLVVYGPVADTNTDIHPDKLPADGGWMDGSKLTVTQHVAANDVPFVIMLAEGNAKLTGRTFHGLADTVSYDESKGTYTLRSLGKAPATIWRQIKPGEQASVTTAQRMEWTPVGKRLRILSTSTIDGFNLQK